MKLSQSSSGGGGAATFMMSAAQIATAACMHAVAKRAGRRAPCSSFFFTARCEECEGCHFCADWIRVHPPSPPALPPLYLFPCCTEEASLSRKILMITCARPGCDGLGFCWHAPSLARLRRARPCSVAHTTSVTCNISGVHPPAGCMLAMAEAHPIHRLYVWHREIENGDGMNVANLQTRK